MKKFVSVLVMVLVLSIMSGTCYADLVYPEYEGANQTQPEITERINIVFDNSGHEHVKRMLTDIVYGAAAAENTAIWIYPVAGNAEPVRVTPGKEFMDKHFAAYSKSSNEFKAENVMDTAMADLLKDTSVTSKRFILYANIETAEIRSEYNLFSGMAPYFENGADVVFSAFSSYGNMTEKRFVDNNEMGNVEYISDCDFFGFMCIKNGYSLSEYVYDEGVGVLKIEKSKGDNNIIVIAEAGYAYTGTDAKAEIYLGGCMMGSAAYETYLKKGEVKGVALSYNHTLFADENTALAMYTADGAAVDPVADDMYIPLIHAGKIKVYHRNRKGSGVCSADTKYKTAQDKDIINYNAPAQESEGGSEETGVGRFDLGNKKNNEPKGVWGRILGIIGGIFKFIFALIRLGILAFIVLLIANRKFRSYIQLKILNTKFAPTYEKIVIKVKKIMADIAGAGTKIRGNADLKGDYIFISKSSADMGLPNSRIKLVVKELESRGIACWLSENGIKPGENYNVVLPQAIKSCTMMALFISPISAKSQEVITEVATAKENKKTIIPVQIEPFDLFKEFPDWAYMLKQYQKTDLFSSKEQEIKALADQIEASFKGLKK